jgi:hypothetical protein
MKQSDFVVKCNEDKIFKLKKLLYGIKQYWHRRPSILWKE